jgi:hypothetical protein
MKTLVHYQNILNGLFRFGTKQPLEHLDRLWDNLETSGLDIYISSRGLNTICREVYQQGGVEVANLARARIMSIFQICPPVSLEQVRDFAHLHGGNSYEEALEIYSASSISAEFILSNSPQAFSSFNLTEIALTPNVDLSFVHSYRGSRFLPILLVGDLADIWFLANSIGLKRNLESVNLKQWFQGNTFDHSWYPVEELNVNSLAQPAYRSRNVRRGKLITLGLPDQREVESVALIVAVSNPLKEFNVTIELVSSRAGGSLPNCLKLQILDSNGLCVEQDIVNHQDGIVMEIEGEESERFSIQISHNGFMYQENFVI